MSDLGKGGPLDRCPQCLYNLTGLPASHTCPECAFAYHERMQMWVQLPPGRWQFLLALGAPMIGIVLICLAWVPRALQAGRGTLPILFSVLIAIEIAFLAAAWHSLRKHRAMVVLDDDGVRTRTFWRRGLKFVPWSSLRLYPAADPRSAAPTPQAVTTASPDGSCLREYRRRLLMRDDPAPPDSGEQAPDDRKALADRADQLEARHLMTFCPGCGRTWTKQMLMAPCDRCGFAVDDVTRVFTGWTPSAVRLGCLTFVTFAAAVALLPATFAFVRPESAMFGLTGCLWLAVVALGSVWVYRFRHRPFVATSRTGLHFGRLRRRAGERLSWAEFRRLREAGQLPAGLFQAMARPLPGQAGDMQATIERRIAAAAGEADRY